MGGEETGGAVDDDAADGGVQLSGVLLFQHS